MCSLNFGWVPKITQLTIEEKRLKMFYKKCFNLLIVKADNSVIYFFFDKKSTYNYC